ncbi:ATP-binding protein [Sphingomonadaceae bacterium OTU29THOMA1]|nr:ATP-binding protein [Sphingomonadaceae bacterium OTU29THOMA1]
MADWKSSCLMAELVERGDSDKEITFLKTIMPVIENVLESGAPASLDFTLHDHKHSFRVAEMCCKIASQSFSNLSNLEISLLLLASYCHDIGMSPRRSKVKAHYNWLLTADASSLTKSELNAFQTWLDANRSGITAPIEPGTISTSGINRADDALAYYARSRHNDWSEEFIRDELSVVGVSLYPAWIEDLVMLCRSHHEGLSELRNPRFNAKNVGTPASPVNLRFLAAILRIADVLEFAPERTPAVVLDNRDIAPASRIYWQKDHAISFEVDQGEHQLILSAQTPNALIHNAVLTTAEWVDAELALCASLAQENLFEGGVLSAARREVYQWPWPSRLISDVREIPGRFVYIDGNFRPDAKKILTLLSGTALYQRPIVAVRELLQNALDAVREQIAYERFGLPDPLQEDAVSSLRQLHHVTVSLAQSEDKYLLVCEDNGSGMTRSIIEKHVLISGSGIRGETRRLERAAKDAGFAVERTGRFGIGVLSYFMLANSVSITTRRSLESGDTDSNGWKFQINGLDGFGELARETRTAKGTSVTLELKSDEVKSDPNAFFDTLKDYVLDNFRWIPCKLILRNDISGSQPESFGPGWTHGVQSGNANVLNKLFSLDDVSTGSMMTEAEIARRELDARAATEMLERADIALRWTLPAEKLLTDAGAMVRGAVPYFEMHGHDSALFFPADSLSGAFRWGEGAAFRASITNYSSLHGISVSPLVRYKDCLIDFDIKRSAEIMVDRSRLVRDNSIDYRAEITSFRKEIWRRFLDQQTNSVFNAINVACSPLQSSHRAKLLTQRPYWIVRDGINKDAFLRSVDGPIVSVARTSFYDWTSYHFATESVVLEALPIGIARSLVRLRLHYLYGGGHLVVQKGRRNAVFGVCWNAPGTMVAIDHRVLTRSASFPDEWYSVAAVRLAGRTVYNQDHPLIKRLSHVSVTTLSFSNILSVDQKIDEALSSSSAAESFIVASLALSEKNWLWIKENRKEIVRDIYASVNISIDDLTTANAATYDDRAGLIMVSNCLNGTGPVSVDYPDVNSSDTLIALEGKRSRW